VCWGSRSRWLTTTFVERIVPIGLQAFTVSLLDWRLLAFASALSLATGLLFSIGPALQSAHGSTADVLQQHARGNAGGRSRAFRDGLVVLQVAATLVLLVAAGLMLRTLANLNATDRGFDADNVLTMVVPLMPKYAEPSKRPPFYERIIAGVRALPGVRAVAFGSMLPFQSPGNTRVFSVEGRQRRPGDLPDALFRIGTADYLQTLGVTLVEGRLLDARDGADAPRAIVVNETLVRRFMDGQSALGRQIRFDPTEPPFTVVGVVRDVLERGYERDPKPGVYVSQLQGPRFFPTVNLIVRVDSDPLGYAPAIQRIIRSVDPDQPIRLTRSMSEVIALTVGDRRQQTTLLVAFGALALVIASLGLYGLLAQTVAARVREIGVRMALGATWRSVMRMVMARGVVLTSAGCGARCRAGVVGDARHEHIALWRQCDRSADVHAGDRSARRRVSRCMRDSRRPRCSCRSDAGPARSIAAAHRKLVIVLRGPVRLEEGMNLAHRQRDSLLRFLPREDAHFALWREHRALHGDG
jgi:predicted permease